VSEDANGNDQNLSEIFSKAALNRLNPILEYLKTHDTVTQKEARDLTGKSATSVRRLFALLCEAGILEQSGSTRNTIYKITAKNG